MVNKASSCCYKVVCPAGERLEAQEARRSKTGTTAYRDSLQNHSWTPLYGMRHEEPTDDEDLNPAVKDTGALGPWPWQDRDNGIPDITVRSPVLLNPSRITFDVAGGKSASNSVGSDRVA